MIAGMSVGSENRKTASSNHQRAEAEARLRLVCDGTPVVIERIGERWVVADEGALRAELAVLHGLGAGGHAVDRALGVCAALNACLIYPDEVGSLNKQLAALDNHRPERFHWVDSERQIGLTQACAWLNTQGAWQWLLWMLPKRLEPSLERTSWVVPGWYGWERRGQYWEFNGNFAHWLDDDFWQRLADHPDGRFGELAVASDPRAEPARLSELADSEHIEIRDLVAVNPSTPPDTLENLLRRRPNYWIDESRVALRALQNSKTPPGLLAEVVSDEIERQHRFTDHGVNFAYLSWAVAHPRVPARMLTLVEQRLSSRCEGRQSVRGNLAVHPKASPRLLGRLARDPSRHTRARVASHRKVPPELLSQLAHDRSWRVREAAASHAAAPPELLAALAHDQKSRVRRAAGANRSTPQHILDLLTRDDASDVVAAAVCNPGTSADAATAAQRRILDGDDDWRAFTIRERENTPAELLRQLPADPDYDVRYWVASHSNAPAETLELLVEEALAHDDQSLLDALWKNLSLPEAQLERVCAALRELRERPPRRFTSEAQKKQAARSRAERERRANQRQDS